MSNNKKEQLYSFRLEKVGKSGGGLTPQQMAGMNLQYIYELESEVKKNLVEIESLRKLNLQIVDALKLSKVQNDDLKRENTNLLNVREKDEMERMKLERIVTDSEILLSRLRLENVNLFNDNRNLTKTLRGKNKWVDLDHRYKQISQDIQSHNRKLNLILSKFDPEPELETQPPSPTKKT